MPSNLLATSQADQRLDVESGKRSPCRQPGRRIKHAMRCRRRRRPEERRETHTMPPLVAASVNAVWSPEEVPASEQAEDCELIHRPPGGSRRHWMAALIAPQRCSAEQAIGVLVNAADD